MEPFGYWLIGFLTLFAGVFAVRLLLTALAPWIETKKGESVMELLSLHIEQVAVWLGTALALSVPVGAVYASYRLGHDVWDMLK